MARQLKSSERRLLTIFLGMIFLLANLVGINLLLRKQQDLDIRLHALKNDRSEALSWLSDADLWRQRKEWLDNKQPRLQSAGKANAELMEGLQTGAKNHSITIVEQSFAETTSQPSYQEVAVKLKVTGTQEAITRWLAEMQQPENFQAIPALNMKVDNDPTKVTCELTVARWFAPEGK